MTTYDESTHKRMQRPVVARQRLTPEEIDRVAPVITYEQFLSHVFEWEQGQHVSLIGPTDAGKTTMALHLLDEAHYVTVFATKPRDDTLAALEHVGYRKMKRWKSYDPALIPKRLVWPRADQLYSARQQRAIFQEAMNNIYPQGGWCIFFDELWFMCKQLKLETEVKTFLTQARSNKISLMLCTQRPANVPLEIYDMAHHLFFWNDNDKRNLDRISGISWLNADVIREIVVQLEDHQVLYIFTRRRKGKNVMYRFTAPPPPKGQ